MAQHGADAVLVLFLALFSLASLANAMSYADIAAASGNYDFQRDSTLHLHLADVLGVRGRQGKQAAAGPGPAPREISIMPVADFMARSNCHQLCPRDPGIRAVDQALAHYHEASRQPADSLLPDFELWKLRRACRHFLVAFGKSAHEGRIIGVTALLRQVDTKLTEQARQPPSLEPRLWWSERRTWTCNICKHIKAMVHDFFETDEWEGGEENTPISPWAYQARVNAGSSIKILTRGHPAFALSACFPSSFQATNLDVVQEYITTCMRMNRNIRDIFTIRQGVLKPAEQHDHAFLQRLGVDVVERFEPCRLCEERKYKSTFFFPAALSSFQGYHPLSDTAEPFSEGRSVTWAATSEQLRGATVLLKFAARLDGITDERSIAHAPFDFDPFDPFHRDKDEDLDAPASDLAERFEHECRLSMQAVNVLSRRNAVPCVDRDTEPPPGAPLYIAFPFVEHSTNLLDFLRTFSLPEKEHQKKQEKALASVVTQVLTTTVELYWASICHGKLERRNFLVQTTERGPNVLVVDFSRANVFANRNAYLAGCKDLCQISEILSHRIGLCNKISYPEFASRQECCDANPDSLHSMLTTACESTKNKAEQEDTFFNLLLHHPCLQVS